MFQSAMQSPGADPLTPELAPKSKSNDTTARRQLEWPNAKQLLAVLFIYFTLQVILRVWISNSTDLDESEQLMLTQKLSWGYGPQPPLYTWIQFAFFKIFGLSVMPLALFKNLLLLCTYVLTYFNARFVTGRHDCGAAAAASLFFVPQIAWESQRDLTHSVLASTLTTATLFALFRLCTRPGTRAYVLFGLCVGFGMLSKFNYALFFLGLILALLSIPELRPVVLNKRMLLALVIGIILFLPTGIWMLEHHDLAGRSLSKFYIDTSGRWLNAIGAGFGSVARSTVTFLGPLLLIYPIVFWTPPDRTLLRLPSVHARLLFRMLLIIYAVLGLGILVFRATDIRDRWFQPILISAPILIISLLQSHLNPVRLKCLLGAAAVVMVLVSVSLPGRIVWAERLGRTQPLNRPYDELARQLGTSLAQFPVVVTDTRLTGGNLRLQLPDKLCLTPELVPIFTRPGERCAFVWDATQRTNLPGGMARFAGRYGRDGLTNEPVRYFSATFKFYRARQMRVGVILPRDNQLALTQGF